MTFSGTAASTSSSAAAAAVFAISPIKTAPGPSERRRSASAPARHSERCIECKRRVRELLERIYGSCLPNQQFGWPTRLASYAGTSIEPALRNVATALESHRGFGIGEFVKSDTLAGCDFWVPDPGFIVEFDESQHFTVPRKLALSEYADERLLGFSAERWIALCEQHEARDNDPPYRDEQRAWYDTLRDLVPSLKDLQPTVRFYAGALAWCSLDPDSRDDRERFLGLMHRAPPPPGRTAAVRSPSAVTAPTLRVAMVFPKVKKGTSKGIPPSGPGAQKPKLPAASQFAGEPVDIVLFPEGYIRADDDKRVGALRKLASKLDAALLVGAVDRTLATRGRKSQVLLRFDPDGSGPSRDLRKALHGEGRCLREFRLASEQGAPHHRAGQRARRGNDLPRSLPCARLAERRRANARPRIRFLIPIPRLADRTASGPWAGEALRRSRRSCRSSRPDSPAPNPKMKPDLPRGRNPGASMPAANVSFTSAITC